MVVEKLETEYHDTFSVSTILYRCEECVVVAQSLFQGPTIVLIVVSSFFIRIKHM